MGWVAFILAGGIGVPTAVFLLARHLVYNDGRQAHADAYIERYRAERELATRHLAGRDAELVAAANEHNRRTVRPRRRPVAAVTAAPHHDTRWSTVGGGR